MRATVHLLEHLLSPPKESLIYVTEQTTPMFACLASTYPNLVGSEFLGSMVPYGTANPNGVRNESITKLTFQSHTFDFILSFDVFEHVPDYLTALRECLRCLKSRGALMFTVPFDPARSDTLVVAVVHCNGDVQHLVTPEYHGDPLCSAGCLSYYTFGWELLDQIRNIGFSSVSAIIFWSLKFAYFGSSELLFVARK
jgi:SAM-dependent methyltransferase